MDKIYIVIITFSHIRYRFQYIALGFANRIWSKVCWNVSLKYCMTEALSTGIWIFPKVKFLSFHFDRNSATRFIFVNISVQANTEKNSKTLT